MQGQSCCSSQSCDGLVSVDHLDAGVLVVDALPLIVVVVHVVDVTVDDWLPHVTHPEKGKEWESQSGPVARETQVQVAIALVRGEGGPPALI